jgi:anti-sigma regulatory factor (Ser/Thr protein kinase)
MTDSRVSLVLKALLPNLSVLREAVGCFIDFIPDEVEKSRIILSIDEAATNIIIHGYSDNSLEGNIYIEMIRESGRIKFVLIDDSPPFDPLSLPGLSDDKFSDKVSPGGLGVHSYMKIMDAAYDRDSIGRNRLTLSRGINT